MMARRMVRERVQNQHHNGKEALLDVASTRAQGHPCNLIMPLPSRVPWRKSDHHPLRLPTTTLPSQTMIPAT
ncbi:hypothetical protein VTN77DRAFT_8344 [Rasamsonia byssochlamydoides]|uniref:uncharacterized protein n=1 Tax=Rasamsonia byssochlamydoides TaxID=89139 RepID=UPI003742FC3A